MQHLRVSTNGLDAPGASHSSSKDSEDLLTSRYFVRRWGNMLGKAAPLNRCHTEPEHETLSDSFYAVNLHRNNLLGLSESCWSLQKAAAQS
jgi:hypothetical protein